ncbi:MAG: NUDIX hydrolase [Bacteroidetes bacterium]|nr:NUDIX hydrolase [Bacteroidota bacterium]
MLENGNRIVAEREPADYNGNIYKIPINDFYKFAVSVDCVIFGFSGDDLEVLLIKRGTEPFKGKWAVPGDLVYPFENIDDAAKRVLGELTGLTDMYFDQSKSFGEVNRHPIGRVVTIGYFSLIKKDEQNPKASSWAEQLEWHKLNKLPDLAFDHNQILEASMERLRKRVRRQPIGFNLLPDKFTLLELKALYESVLGEPFDKSNFRKKFLDMDLLTDINQRQTNVKHRPAKLFSFNQKRYEELTERGFNFSI